LPESALFGFAGEVACELSRATGADPAAILLTFLAFLGNCVGSQPHLWFGGAYHCARLFVLLVGDAAHGLKGTSLNAVDRLFARADPAWHAERIRSGLQSPEAMVELVADGPHGDCRLQIVEPEYPRLVSRSATSGTFSALLRRAFDGPPLQLDRSRHGVNDPRSTIRSSHAHVSMVAHITPEEFARVLPVLRRAGGLETRLLYGIVHRQAEVNPFKPPVVEYDSLAERLGHVIETSRARVLEKTDPISRELCVERGVQPRVRMPEAHGVSEYWTTLSARMPKVHPDYEHLLHRGPVHVVHLAHGYAIAEEARFLAEEHLDAALSLYEFCARSAERIYSTPTGLLIPAVNPRRRGQLLEYLSRKGGWVSREEISNTVFCRNLSKAELDATTQSLVDDGLIVYQTNPQTGGRPRTEYRAADPDAGAH